MEDYVVQQSLLNIRDLVEEELASGDPILYSTHKLLKKIYQTLPTGIAEEPRRGATLYIHIEQIYLDDPVLTCVGYQGAWKLDRQGEKPGNPKPIAIRGLTEVEATIDVIYDALTTIFALHNTLSTGLDIFLENEASYMLLNGKQIYEPTESEQRRKDILFELMFSLPVPIAISLRRGLRAQFFLSKVLAK